MRRRRHTPFPREVVQPVVDKDEATGVAADSARPRADRYANLTMPHERDERTETPNAPTEVVTQAADDLAKGSRDTDLYAKVGTDFDRTSRRS